MPKHLYFAFTTDMTGNKSASVTVATNSAMASSNILKGGWHRTIRELTKINDLEGYKIMVFKDQKLPTTGTRERTP